MSTVLDANAISRTEGQAWLSRNELLFALKDAEYLAKKQKNVLVEIVRSEAVT
jgi:hypothetical protein